MLFLQYIAPLLCSLITPNKFSFNMRAACITHLPVNYFVTKMKFELLFRTRHVFLCASFKGIHFS
jgi:hypothetical protein